MRAALYARISQDEAGTEKGVQRQLEDARALAEARGWSVVGEWTDNDVSAYSGARRDGYQALMDAAGNKQFDRIVIYMTSRLWRSRAERAQAMDILAANRISVAAVSGPELDLTSASGRMVAGILGEFDTAESAIKSERIARAALQRAQEGRASGPVLYGWRRERILDDAGRPVSFRDVEDPMQAKIVGEITDRLILGEPLRSIAEDLNERGEPVPSGREDVRWRSGTCRKLALRPANIAKRVHHGEVIGDAAWPAIVSPEQFDRVTALLTNPRRRKSRDATRKHLLTYGIGKCGVCGSVLRAVARKQKRKRTEDVTLELYVCDVNGCVGRYEEKVDELVSAVVIERLSRPDARDVFTPPADDDGIEARKQADDLRRRLDEAAEDYAEGILDRQQLAAITARIRPALDEAEAEVARSFAQPSGERLQPLFDGQADEAWSALDVVARRQVLNLLGITVAIMPTRQGPGFEPTDVVIEWGS